MKTPSRALALALATLTLGLAACTTLPTGPSVLVLPGSTKTFEQFRIDDAECRQFAHLSVGGRTAEQAQTGADRNDSTLNAFPSRQNKAATAAFFVPARRHTAQQHR